MSELDQRSASSEWYAEIPTCRFDLVPELRLGNPDSRSFASPRRKRSLQARHGLEVNAWERKRRFQDMRSQAGAWERVVSSCKRMSRQVM